MSQQAKKFSAGAVGAKTARACDSCLRRRARWYCAADDAFLCQLCDNSVHSANPLARRHQRVGLKTASSSSFKPGVFENDGDAEPAWHHGFKRKARTPRGGAKGSIAHKEHVQGMFGRADTIVPDLELASLEEFAALEEEQLLYCVPILDPVLAELCSPPILNDEAKAELVPQPDQSTQDLTGFLIQSDTDIPEFEVDFDSLLGRGLDGDTFSMEGLGLVEAHEQSIPAIKKEEEVEECEEGLPLIPDQQLKVDEDLSGETIDINFDCGSHGDEKPAYASVDDDGCAERKRRRTMLDLDYEGVICTWDKQACPWVDGERPQFDLDEWSLDFMWEGGGDVHRAVLAGGASGHAGGGDGGREARVSRYREKRRTRLFSKKIRYEVRKLNAEKRPRMKGRFVKRTALLSNATGNNGVIVHPQCVF